MFQDSTGHDVGNAKVERTRAINSRDGVIERHHRSYPHVDQQGHTFEGTCVLIDEPVCAIGYFSQRENGFISDITVYCGTPETAISDIGSSISAIVWRLVAGLFGLLAVGIWVAAGLEN
jgi:hypothetical protein